MIATHDRVVISKKNKRCLRLFQDLTWNDFCKLALEQAVIDMEDVYFARRCNSSKKLKFLKCWMKQIKKSRSCSLMVADKSKTNKEVTKEIENRVADLMQESEQPIPSSVSLGEDSLTGAFRNQDDAAFDMCSGTLESFTTYVQSKRGLGKSSSRPCFEVDLPDAEIGKVRLRFAPEPSGYLHIGHSKAALLNQYFAQRYQGQLIVRFDDTNPAKESNEFVDNLLKDIETLGIKYEAVTYTSDYFPDLMEMAETLILLGKAYVDDTPREQMKRERMVGIESKCRNNSVEENMKLWKEMVVGSQRGLQCCLRGKLDMQDPNKSLRDPVYYRCNPLPHHRIGSKYKIYPTYDFACPFVDARQGISHALRSSEHHDRNAQYCRIQEDMGMRKVHIYEFSRLNMVYTLLSKRNLLWFVQTERLMDGMIPVSQLYKELCVGV
ncbi:hypothetical protein LWI29_020668 [Acer saccharum]|uniref:Glutamyl/glutaminyl-tRNA synthetase class Ib catalytic domain-containing protein n=1 Tax=Acer saccharum TaxID=4024 RepID=A0AA39VYG8_ACESA|nr:hypothetical protein LWI29_020668 [Acer saccharum]